MWELLWLLGTGFALGLSLAVPPGPILAFSADRTIREGFWPGVAVPLGASTADATQALLMGFGVLPLLAGFPRLLSAINVAGGLLMLLFAWFAFQGARSEVPESSERTVGRFGGFGAGYGLALSSPYNLAWWLGVGTALFQDYGAWLLVGFFTALVLWSFVFVALTAWAHARMPKVVSWISYASVAVLVGFGLWIVWGSLPGALA